MYATFLLLLFLQFSSRTFSMVLRWQEGLQTATSPFQFSLSRCVCTTDTKLKIPLACDRDGDPTCSCVELIHFGCILHIYSYIYIYKLKQTDDRIVYKYFVLIAEKYRTQNKWFLDFSVLRRTHYLFHLTSYLRIYFKFWLIWRWFSSDTQAKWLQLFVSSFSFFTAPKIDFVLYFYTNTFIRFDSGKEHL